MGDGIIAAMKAIAGSYHKIILANLQSNTHQKILINEEEVTEDWGYSDTTSEWIKGFAECDKIHPEDRDHFLFQLGVEQLKKRLAAGEEEIIVRYRRLYKNEYRWTIMSMIKVEDYSDENPVVCVCMKDIHKGYLDEIEDRDYVTGGLNRKGFMKYGRALLDAIPDVQSLAVLNFNVKGFKAINEMFGTTGGDEVLKELYGHIKECFLKPMALARVEGDSFSCIVNRENLDYALLNSICLIIYEKNDKRVKIDLKCGIYLVEDKTLDLHKMYDYAKLAVQNVSDHLTSSYVVFDEKMRYEYLKKNEIQGRFPLALAENEFEVYYQPVYVIETNDMTGAEAYVRWNYPERGVLTPEVFLNYLEESGVVTQLDYFVVCQVRDMMLERKANGLSVLPISVNLSWMDFYDKKMMDTMMDIVENLELPLLFELSEKSYQILLEREDEGINKLRHMSRRLFLDSFGSGDASFGLLRNYQIESVKFNRSFIQKLDTDSRVKSLVHSMIDLFSHFNTIVTAVGVETQGQLEFLRRQGCHFAQGNYLMKPLARAEFEEYLNSYEKGNVEHGSSGTIGMGDFLDVEALQSVQDCFSEMTGLAALLTNAQGDPITVTKNIAEFCQYVRSTEEGCEACRKCDFENAQKAKEKGKPFFYRCHAGLYDFAAPVVVNDEYVGCFVGGQVLIGEPDIEEFRGIAKKKGLDPDRYVALLESVPIIDEDKVNKAINYVSVNTNVLSSLAYKQYLLDQSNDMLQDKNLELDFLANFDKLTKLSNRHHAQDYFREYEESGKEFCVALGDIDDFKKVNDTYGHDCGDAVLVAIADKMNQVLDKSGVPCRWGGEEFLCLIYGEREYALSILEELRKALESSPIEYQGNRVQVTMTFGLTYCQEQQTIEKMISTADKRLYSGKRNGKNQVVWEDATTFSMNTVFGSMMNFGPMNA